MQKMTDAPLTKCRRAASALSGNWCRHRYSAQGGGWYETDFKSAQENKRNLVGAEKEERRRT